MSNSNIENLLLGVTIFESFTFCFNMCLTDVAAPFPQIRDEIVVDQLN